MGNFSLWIETNPMTHRLQSTLVLGIGSVVDTAQGIQFKHLDDSVAMNALWLWERSAMHDALISAMLVTALTCKWDHRSQPDGTGNSGRRPTILTCNDPHLLPLRLKAMVWPNGTEYSIMICQESYPNSVAWHVLKQSSHQRPSLADLQTPTKFDKLLNIEKELQSVKANIHLAIDKLMVHGERLEDLQERSRVLAADSKIYLDRTKRLNRCCVLL